MQAKESAEAWLRAEDEGDYSGRLDRLVQVQEVFHEELGDLEMLGFSGGMRSKMLYEEARYCYTYGQFFAVVLTGMAFIEAMLVSERHAAGQNRVPNFATLLREEKEDGWLSEEEFNTLNQARTIRNRVAHTDLPLGPGSIERRAIECDLDVYDVLQNDALMVIRLVFRALTRGSFSY